MSSLVLRSIGGFAALAWLAMSAAPAHSRPIFLAKYHQFDAGTPQSTELADLDADGDLDLVVLSSSDLGVRILLGDGSSDFETWAFLPLPSPPIASQVARVNTDAHLDLVVTHGIGTLSVFYGNGDGTFGPRIDVTVGNTPAAVEVGDLDEDGRNDILVMCQGSDQLWVLFGLFDQFWFPIVQFPTELDPSAVTLADLNADTHLDVVVLNQTSGTVTTRLGDGQGGLGAPITQTGYASMRDLVVADLDQDTILDVATTNGNQGSVGIFKGNGDGTLQLAESLPVAMSPQGLAVVDANADAVPDLVVTLPQLGTFALLRGTGGGSFASPVQTAAAVAPLDVSAGDLDGDGTADLAVANASGISIHHSNGDGTFGFTPPSYSIGGGDKYLLLRDLDADGKLDLAAVSDPDALLAILWGRGDGTFDAGPTFPTGQRPGGIAVGDIDGDGGLDLATADYTSNTISLFVRSGPRTYTPAGSVAAPGGPHRVELAHLNGDALLDLVVLGFEDVSIYPGLGGGNFGSASSVPVAPAHHFYVNDLDVADVNLDGDLDAIVAESQCCPSSVWQFLGNGNGTLQPGVALWSSSGSQSALGLDVGLLDGNSSPDLGIVFRTNSNRDAVPMQFRSGNGDGTYASLPDGFASYLAIWVEMGDFDSDAANDVVVANEYLSILYSPFAQPGQVSLQLGRGDGTFESRHDFGIDGRPTRFAAGDLNGDGALDLVVGDSRSSRVFVLLNQRGTTTDAGDIVPAGVPTATLSVRHASGNVRIEYDAGGRGTTPIALEIFDVRGRRIRSLQKATVAPGPHVLGWNGDDDAGSQVARGVYWVNLRTPTANLERKIVHLKR